MATTTPTQNAPRRAALPHSTAMRLAATEYQRVVDLLTSLHPHDWTSPTDCPDWDVQAMAAHMLGMAEMAASLREQSRQVKAAEKHGGAFLDALTALQVEEHAHLTPDQIITRYAQVAPKAARGRRWTPALIRRRTLPQRQTVAGREETWTIGYLTDVILTRDPWMHRIDLTRATGATHVLTADHDGIIVDDLVTEWAQRHGQPFTLRLTGPAGGTWTANTTSTTNRDNTANGADTVEPAYELELDVSDFCRAISGRQLAEGLLATEVPF